jgi:phage-related holin
VTFQPDETKQILNGGYRHFVVFTISVQHAVHYRIYILLEQAESIIWMVSSLYWKGTIRSTQTIIQKYSVRFCYFGCDQAIFLACLLFLCHLTDLISGTHTINIQHVVIFLFFTILNNLTTFPKHNFIFFSLI